MSKRNRPDLGTFVNGDWYRHDDSDELVEYVGQAFMHELDGESVGIFRLLDPPGRYMVATLDAYERGETFTLVGDALRSEAEHPTE